MGTPAADLERWPVSLPGKNTRTRGPGQGGVNPEQTNKEQRTLSRLLLNLQPLWQESQSLPPGMNVPSRGLGFSFTLDELRDVVVSAQYQTMGQELVNDIDDYPIELYAALKSWAGGACISFDSGNELVRLT